MDWDPIIGFRPTPEPEPIPEPEPKPNFVQKARNFVRRAFPFAAGIIVALGAILLYNLLFPGPSPLTENDVNQAVVNAMASATPPPAYSAQVYQAIQPSLVLIQAKMPEGSHGNYSLGSGVIIDDQGDILTSLHVVDGAEEIELTFFDGTKSNALILSSQPENDIAVLAAEQLPGLIVPAVLGNPNAMNVGDEAYAVGNPFGLYSSMSAGVISGFGRSFQPEESDIELKDLIQIDAAVNPGNSGGPLLNRQGQVVGIVVGIINPVDQEFFVGVGFAVPIQVAAGGAGAPLQ